MRQGTHGQWKKYGTLLRALKGLLLHSWCNGASTVKAVPPCTLAKMRCFINLSKNERVWFRILLVKELWVLGVINTMGWFILWFRWYDCQDQQSSYCKNQVGRWNSRRRRGMNILLRTINWWRLHEENGGHEADDTTPWYRRHYNIVKWINISYLILLLAT